MALTRKFLKAMGIEDEKIDQIIDAHGETVDALKEQINQYKESAEELPATKTALEEAKKQLDDAGKDPYKVKYEAIKEDFEKYKADATARQTHAAKESAYRDALKKAGVAEKRIESILRVTDVDGIKINTDGKIEDADALAETIKAEWADFIPTSTTTGANVPTPQGGNAPDYDNMSDEEYYKAKFKKG